MSAARRLDWIKIKAILDPKDFSTVNQYRQRHTELTRLLAQSVPQVDLSQYRQQLTNQQVVSDIEQVLGQFKPKKAQVDSVLKDLDQQEQEAVESALGEKNNLLFLGIDWILCLQVKSARETVAKVEETVSEYKNNLDGLKNLPHHDQLTVIPGLVDETPVFVHD